jgi:hypothetical protein
LGLNFPRLWQPVKGKSPSATIFSGPTPILPRIPRC